MEEPNYFQNLPEQLPSDQPQEPEELSTWEYILIKTRQILWIELGLVVLAFVTFIFTGGISLVALSERIFWMAMIPMALGAFGVLAVVATGGTLGAGRAYKVEEARKILHNQVELRKTADRRYDFSIQMWVAGMICIGISALVQTISSVFTQ